MNTKTPKTHIHMYSTYTGNTKNKSTTQTFQQRNMKTKDTTTQQKERHKKPRIIYKAL